MDLDSYTVLYFKTTYGNRRGTSHDTQWWGVTAAQTQASSIFLTMLSSYKTKYISPANSEGREDSDPVVGGLVCVLVMNGVADGAVFGFIDLLDYASAVMDLV